MPQEPTTETPATSSAPEVESNAPVVEEKIPESAGDWKIIPTVTEIDEDLKAGKLIGHRVHDVASAITSVKTRVKNASSIMRFGIETFESFTDPLLLPIVQKLDENVVGAVDPLISYAYKSALATGEKLYNIVDADKDGTISLSEAASAPVNIFQSLVVESEWFDKVDEILNPDNISASKMVEFFNEKAKEEFKKLVELAEDAKSTVDMYTSKEFVESLEAKMGNAWDEKLKGPAEEFYAMAKAEYKRIDTDGDGYISVEEALAALKPIWEEKIVKAFKDRIRPAIKAYKVILQEYKTYRKMAEQKGLKMTAEEFIARSQERLQVMYDERLAPHIKEVYEGASKIVTEDLERIVQALDMDDDGILTLNDFLVMADRFVVKFVETPYQKVLEQTLNAADYVLPADEKVEEKVDAEKIADDLSLSLVTKTISKRLVRKAFTGLSDLKVRAEKLVGPNLIKYAEDLIKDVHDNQLSPAIKNLEEKVELFKGFMSEKMKPVQSAALEVMESPRAQELKKRFALAIERARGMAKEGYDYVLKRDLLKLPLDIATFFAMTVGIKEKDADFGLVVEHVSGLLTAILNVVKIVNWKEEKADESPEKEEEATKEAKEKEDEDKQST